MVKVGKDERGRQVVLAAAGLMLILEQVAFVQLRDVDGCRRGASIVIRARQRRCRSLGG